MVKLTPTERRLYDLLADGLPHTYEEVRGCVADELTERKNVNLHLFKLRQKIGDRGLDVVARGQNGTTTWRMVRYLNSAE